VAIIVEIAVQTEKTLFTGAKQGIMKSILPCNAEGLRQFFATAIHRRLKVRKREVVEKS
jgi:hypothetical protein